MPGRHIKIGELIKCFCNTALARKMGHGSFEVLLKNNGKTVIMNVDHGSGLSKISCPDCGYQYMSIRIPGPLKAL